MKYALGIDVGASKMSGALLSDEGILSGRRQTPTDRSQSAQVFTEQIVGFIKQFRLLDADAVGVGFPGLFGDGVMVSSANIKGFEQFPLAQTLKEALQKPVFAANDADMALQGERWLGQAKGKRRPLMLTVGSGIGGAIAGKPSAQLGHTVVDPGSVLTCNAGHRGDIEALIGGIVTQKRLGRPMTELLKDPVYLKFFVRWLGRGIKLLIDQYRPDLVVLGGGMMGSADMFFNQLSKFAVPVVLAKLGADAGIYGAARAAMQGGLR